MRNLIKITKKILIAFIFLSGFQVFGQTEEALSLINSLDGKWSLENNEIKIQEVIVDSTKTKDDLYFLVKSYIVLNYNDSKSVIQLDDKENGAIICKGIYGEIRCDEVFWGSAGITSFFHTLKIEIKDFRIRVTVYLTNSETFVPAIYVGGSYSPAKNINSPIVNYYPISKADKGFPEKKLKTRDCYILYRGISRGISSIERLKNEILNSKPVKVEQSEW